MKQSVLLTLTAVLGLSGCSKQPSEPADTTPYIERSQELAGQLQQTLGNQLKQAMQAGGPVQAIQVCQLVAQDLTNQVSHSAEEIDIRRTALRTRNPANRADPASTSVLEYWEALQAAKEPLKPHVIQNDEAVIVHLPIMTGDICLSCHGDTKQFTEPLREQLAKLYPEDQATGFQLGELRGAFRIDFPK